MMNKYYFHLPFCRQIAMLKMTGFHLPQSTLNGWFQGSSDLLRALYLRLKDIVLASDYIQVDESNVATLGLSDHESFWKVDCFLPPQGFTRREDEQNLELHL